MAGASEDTADRLRRSAGPSFPAAVTVAYGPHPSQHVELRFPQGSGAASLLVILHGGFWRSQYDMHHIDHVCAALTHAGFITANVEYRRLPEPGSGWPGTFEDVEAAVGFARTLAGDRIFRVETVFALGHSAGGHLALWLAGQRCGLDGVIALAPIACLGEAWRLRIGRDAVVSLLSGTPEEVPGRYDSACPARRPALAPRLLIHGDDDSIVPVQLSRLYMEARSADPVVSQLNVIPYANHFDLIDPASRAWASVLDGIESFVHLV